MSHPKIARDEESRIGRDITTSAKIEHSWLIAVTPIRRVIRSIYTLRYLRDPQLERNVHRTQNRIESYQQLSSTIAQVGGKKELTGRTDIENWNERIADAKSKRLLQRKLHHRCRRQDRETKNAELSPGVCFLRRCLSATAQRRLTVCC